MKKIFLIFTAFICVLTCSCGSSDKLSVSTPEKAYVTYCSGPDEHTWELSRVEIDHWVDWMNDLSVSPVGPEESKALIDHTYRDGAVTQYLFDVGPDGSSERIVYLDLGPEHSYLRLDDDWYSVENPTEPFNRY